VMSHRIAVMSFGEIVQVGTPEAIYEHAATPFVAAFLGVANFLPGEVVGEDAAGVRVRLRDGTQRHVLSIPGPPAAGHVLVCIRPEALRLDPAGPLHGRVIRRTYLGGVVDYLVQIGSETIRVTVPAGSAAPAGEEVRLSVTQAAIYPAASGGTSSGRSTT
ncbi:MAG: TOBE domain-containing protein, partial [bacterium]